MDIERSFDRATTHRVLDGALVVSVEHHLAQQLLCLLVAPSVVDVLLGLRADQRHHLRRLLVELPDGGLRGEDQAVDAVDDGVGNIYNFGARRPQPHDHRLHDLGEQDDGLASQVALFNDVLLKVNYIFQVQLQAKVAPSDNNAV